MSSEEEKIDIGNMNMNVIKLIDDITTHIKVTDKENRELKLSLLKKVNLGLITSEQIDKIDEVREGLRIIDEKINTDFDTMSDKYDSLKYPLSQLKEQLFAMQVLALIREIADPKVQDCTSSLNTLLGLINRKMNLVNQINLSKLKNDSKVVEARVEAKAAELKLDTEATEKAEESRLLAEKLAKEAEESRLLAEKVAKEAEAAETQAKEDKQKALDEQQKNDENVKKEIDENINEFKDKLDTVLSSNLSGLDQSVVDNSVTSKSLKSTLELRTEEEKIEIFKVLNELKQLIIKYINETLFKLKGGNLENVPKYFTSMVELLNKVIDNIKDVAIHLYNSTTKKQIKSLVNEGKAIKNIDVNIYDTWKLILGNTKHSSKYFKMFGGNNSYEQKYLKYKAKYLKLKQLLMTRI